jgi:hypothetical protein
MGTCECICIFTYNLYGFTVDQGRWMIKRIREGISHIDFKLLISTLWKSVSSSNIIETLSYTISRRFYKRFNILKCILISMIHFINIYYFSQHEKTKTPKLTRTNVPWDTVCLVQYFLPICVSYHLLLSNGFCWIIWMLSFLQFTRTNFCYLY